MANVADTLKSSSKSGTELRLLSRIATATLAYSLVVILFGAVVRVTDSGAGCGQHWPTCNGEFVHLPRRLETLIELLHRYTSASVALPVIALAVLTFLAVPSGHRLRKLALLSLAFTLGEMLIGAGLVLWGLVGHDKSAARVVVMPAHLLLTYALVAVLTLLSRFSRVAGNEPPVLLQPSAPARGLLLAGALAIVLVAATGAITALGDMLYPPLAGTLAGRVTEDQGQAAHWLQRLRVLHPVFAVFTAAFVAHLAVAAGRAGIAQARVASRAVLAFAAVQVLAGGLNVLLSAPGWMQLVHLALALGLWVSFVSMAGELVRD